MTDGSHELALTIINDGEGYKKRCDVARRPITDAFAARLRAGQWLEIANQGVYSYEKQFGTPKTASCFTPEDILLAAAELAEYYAEHVKES